MRKELIMAEDQIISTELSEADRKILFLVHEMRPYEKIEIRLTEDGELSVVSTHTTKEIFPQI